MIDVTAIGEYLIDFTEYGIGDDDSCLFWKNAGELRPTFWLQFPVSEEKLLL